MTTDSSTRLRIANLTIKFPGTVAVDNASIDVKPGEFFTLLGPSGCGKTTLLRTIAGFCHQNEGHIYFNDRLVDLLPAHRRDTGMVFQNYAVFPHLTVWQNIAYGLRARRVPKQEMSERIKEAIRLVDLIGYEERKPSQLSGGQQQRVVVARATVVRPQILLMDEPLANLDAKLRVRLREELRELQRELGITTIYVTHDQEEALSISDRIAVMWMGKVQQIGSPMEVYRHPVSRSVAEFVGEGTFFTGVVRHKNDDEITVELEDGKRLVSDSLSGLETTEGESVGLGFRPQDAKIVINPAPNAENILTGTVIQKMYFGGLVRYNLETSSGLQLQAEEYAPIRDGSNNEGDTISISIPRDRLMVFPVGEEEEIGQ
ncbi:MAG: ABC transporter ATP-binding protein [Candidatus Marinimicrobia bacterium]|nr:ABC transporter ATP-binding protein [Nitrospina sp.]MBT6947811.1 ABC transporter ATP-binding protein [Candidatus Neomarinimicrobiota bacterium]